MTMKASSRGLYATLAVVALATVLLAGLLLRPADAIPPEHRVSFQFDEPAVAAPAAEKATSK
jgi:hypothetical protein